MKGSEWKILGLEILGRQCRKIAIENGTMLIIQAHVNYARYAKPKLGVVRMTLYGMMMGSRYATVAPACSQISINSGLVVYGAQLGVMTQKE